MSALPKQVKALEERVSVLEEQAKNPVPVADPCPLCEKPLKITKVDLHRTFGDMGVQMRTHTCEPAATAKSGCTIQAANAEGVTLIQPGEEGADYHGFSPSRLEMSVCRAASTAKSASRSVGAVMRQTLISSERRSPEL